MLNADKLTVERGDMTVLDGVTTELRPGEITAIVGPNGAGKSTLLLALAGLLEPVSGKVTLGGAAIAALPALERAKALGYLPQHGEIAWDVAVENLVALGRMPHGDRGREAVARALKALELEQFSGRPASKLSGGERARVLLARVLAGEPQWILADEPLAALDLAHQLSLITHFIGCAKAGQGVVIVLHNLALAMNHADRVLVLDRGKMAADGAPDEALTPDVIQTVWGVSGEWIGEAGARAFVTGVSGPKPDSR